MMDGASREEEVISKAVRLQGSHGKYLWAEDDHVTVSQVRDGGASDMSLWSLEQVANTRKLRLKSCYGCYLTASNIPCVVGVSGMKVLQTRPSLRLDSSVEWEVVVVDETRIKLRSHTGFYLQANSGLPPWRSSVAHDDSYTEWCLWKVEIVEFSPQARSLPKMPPLYDGRVVFYLVAEDESEVNESSNWHYVFFRGRSPEKLTRKLRKEVDGEKIAVCIRHPASSSTKLYPVHLELPPGTSPIYLVVLKKQIQ